MATISKLLSFIALFLLLANKLVHSQDITSFTFDNFSPTTNGLTYQGGAHVPSGSTFLRLTETDSSGHPKSWSAGRVLYTRPVRFWESGPNRQATFETTINFLIRPSQKGAADGLVFFIAPVNTTIPSGATGANLGIFGSSGTTSSLFAVEFDTYANGWDPNFRHIGIDIQSRASKNVTRFDSATGQLVSARINYNPYTRTITVIATSSSRTASLSYVFDLKTILPQQVQVGISSANGQHVTDFGIHDVISCEYGEECFEGMALWQLVNSKIHEVRRGNPCSAWHRPTSGFMKLNIDAAFFKDSHKTGLGMVLQDDTGTFIKVIPGCLDLSVGEAVGILESLSWVSNALSPREMRR